MPTDPKVLHNIAIAEYVQGGQRDARKLLASLEALKQRLEDARAEAEYGEGDAVGEMDPSLTAYNMAVLLYQLKQYARCRAILEDMFANIEPIDEFLAFKLCFLLLDVYLMQRQAERAAEVLAYLDKSFAALTKPDGAKENGVGGNGDGTDPAAAVGGGDGPPPSPTGGGGGSGEGGDWPKKRSARRPPTTVSADEVQSALSLYKAKLALITKASKSSKREIKTTLNACAPNTTGLFLKCHLEWQRQNFRKALKLLNNSCQTKNERDANLPALYFNNMGAIHHCMRRHQSAAFFFTRALQENDSLYRNQADAAHGGISLPTFSCDRRCELEYNRGLQLLLCGRPREAFDSFQVALQLMHSQPRIWLRLGEACMAVHVLQQREQADASGTPAVSPLVASLASASHQSNAANSRRYLVLPTDGPAANLLSTGPPAESTEGGQAAGGAAEGVGGGDGKASTGSPAPPAPTLSYGVKCLRNAVLQCGNQLGGAQLASISASEYASLLASASSGTLSSTDEHTMQLHCVQRLSQLHLAWCALEAADYLPALTWSSQLIGIEACPASLRAYAHLYACDALCHLSRVDEALAQLTLAMELGDPLAPVATSTGAEPAGPDAEGGLDCVRNPYSPFGPLPSATSGGGSAAGAEGGAGGPAGGGRVALYTNLAVVHCLQNNLQQAEGYLQQALSLDPGSHQALLCSVYIELRGGRTEAAVELIKKQRRPVGK